MLIETKQNFTVADEEQLSAYVEYEKALTGNKTVAILANTINDNIKVWRGVVSDSDLMPKETALRTMDEYVDFYTSKINDKVYIQKIHIKNYRNFNDFEMEFHEGLNIIVGANNSGKTELLSAIYLLNLPSNISIDDFNTKIDSIYFFV